MSVSSSLEKLLRRDQAITVAALVVLCALAWAYLISGAGLGMSFRDMTILSLFPHREAAAPAMDMPGMTMDRAATTSGAMPSASRWTPGYIFLMVLMWWVMMIAMMIPSGAPMILLHSRVARHARSKGQAVPAGLGPTALFVAGYLLAWLAFSIGATALQWAVERAGLVSAMMMSSTLKWFSAAVLIIAGIYQWTPYKNVCLRHCRAPAAFLSSHWRPGPLAPLRVGAEHGAYCVGCCWALMALLLVGGVMNPVWIVALALVVLAEKVVPGGLGLSRAGGALLIGWGVATLLIP